MTEFLLAAAAVLISAAIWAMAAGRWTRARRCALCLAACVLGAAAAALVGDWPWTLLFAALGGWAAWTALSGERGPIRRGDQP